MAIFGGGIVWDPREPLPPGYADYGRSKPQPKLRRVDGGTNTANVAYFTQPGGKDGLSRPSPSQPEIRSSASLTIKEAERNILPPWSIGIDVSVLHDTASLNIAQTFWNDSSSIIPQGAFTFPLPNGCAVTGFDCRIGTARTLHGVVKSKDEAQADFDLHKAAGRAVGLVEENTSEIFTARLGNIPANTKVKIELTLATFLKHHFGSNEGEVTTTLTIPTSIAARYGSPDFQAFLSSDIPQGLTLNVEVHGAKPTTSVTSRTHKIAVNETAAPRKTDAWIAMVDGRDNDGSEDADEILLVTVGSDAAFLKNDFVLDIKTTTTIPEQPRAWLQTHPSLEDQKALLVTLPQKFLLQPQAPGSPSEVLFLVDRSGSMEDKMKITRSAMYFLLKGIPQGKKFNIWSFGSSYTSLWPSSVDYSEDNLKTALSYISNSFEADLGGTEILPALKAMMGTRDTTLATDVIVLTDGQIWRLDSTLEFVQQRRQVLGKSVRFFSLGIGDEASHALVEGIAKFGGGYSEMIPSSQLEGIWEDRLISITKAALTTSTTSRPRVSLVIKKDDRESEVQLDSMTQSQDFNGFMSHRLLFILDSATSAKELNRVVINNHDEKTPTFRANVDISHVPAKMAALHSLAAKSLLDDLDAQMGQLLAYPDPDSDNVRARCEAIRMQAENMAQTWSLVSRWTSFFLVDKVDSLTKPSSVSIGRNASLLAPVVFDRPARVYHRAPKVACEPTDEFEPRITMQERHCRNLERPIRLKPSPPPPEEPYSRILPAPSPPVVRNFADYEPPSPPIKDPSSVAIQRQQLNAFSSPVTRTSQAPATLHQKNRAFVQHILSFQQYDGSFDFSDRSSLRKAVGNDVATKMEQPISQGRSKRMVYTAIIIFLLERDFHEQRGLWELIYMKATSYLESCSETLDKAEMQKSLSGVYLLPEEDADASVDTDSSIEVHSPQPRPPRVAMTRVPNSVD